MRLGRMTLRAKVAEADHSARMPETPSFCPTFASRHKSQEFESPQVLGMKGGPEYRVGSTFFETWLGHYLPTKALRPKL